MFRTKKSFIIRVTERKYAENCAAMRFIICTLHEIQLGSSNEAEHWQDM